MPAPFIAADAGAPAEFSLPFSPPTCYQKAVVLGSPPIPAKPRPTTCTLLTTRDPTEALCSGPAFPAEVTAWRCSRRTRRQQPFPPSGWVGFLDTVTDLSSTPPFLPGPPGYIPLLHRLPGDPNAVGDTIRSPPHLFFGDDHWGTTTAPPTLLGIWR